jgi:NAD(P)-dependent dehydrogenase (short-subunit alcohol dehydrogenase family)
VNVQGVYLCTRAVIDGMAARGRGSIINMASIAASAGLADRFAYSMTKGAVVAMTYSIARDFVTQGVRCNCISPARVHTPFVDNFLGKTYPGREAEVFARLAAAQPVGRMGRPDEVATLARFLASDEASFITGTDYPLDGGFLRLHG